MNRPEFNRFIGNYELRIKALFDCHPTIGLARAAQSEFDQVTGVHGMLIPTSRNLKDYTLGFALFAEALWWSSKRPYLLPYQFVPEESYYGHLFRWAVHLPDDYESNLQAFLAVPMHRNAVHSLIDDPIHKIEVLARRIKECPDPPDMLILQTLDKNFQQEYYVGPSNEVVSDLPRIAEAHRIYLGCCKEASENLDALHPLVSPFRHRWYSRATPERRLQFEQEAINKSGQLGYELCRNPGLRSRTESRTGGGSIAPAVLEDMRP